jgi:tRNA modification GTPase
MREGSYDTDDCIMALATPWGEAALAVIRMAGEGSIERVAEVFSSGAVLCGSEGNTVHYGTIRHPQKGASVDEVTVTVFRAPRSYCGQDSVEITCHGSLPGIVMIREVLREVGFRDASPGEFTLRAFLNGKMDLTRAEAVNEIVSAKTRNSHSLALSRLSGSIQSEIGSIKSDLVQVAAALELVLDYPEDEVGDEVEVPPDFLESAGRRLADLSATFRTGRMYREGVPVALAGRTNAGKSSLFNLFLKEDRSIVSDVHGTTRDYIESWISLRGIPVRLFDTAGLRDTASPVEVEGVRRSRNLIQAASLVLYVVDSLDGISSMDEDFVEEHRERCIPVWNKIDLWSQEREAVPEGYVRVSSATGEGFRELEARIFERLHTGIDPFDASTAVLDSQRQKDLIDQAAEAVVLVTKGLREGLPADIVMVDLRDALTALGEITGEVTSADILERIFSDFCVGK